MAINECNQFITKHPFVKVAFQSLMRYRYNKVTKKSFLPTMFRENKVCELIPYFQFIHRVVIFEMILGDRLCFALWKYENVLSLPKFKQKERKILNLS